MTLTTSETASAPASSAGEPERHAPSGRVACRREAAIAAAVAVAASAFILARFVVHQDAYVEWANYYWLIAHQTENLRSGGPWPSLFVHTLTSGLFYPQYAFASGTLFTVAAYLGLALGSAWMGFIGVWFLGFVAAYLSTWWIGRQVGLGALAAHAPAVILVTAPYTITNLYGRGDLSESMALFMIPLAVAASLSLLRGDAPVGPRMVALVASLTMLSGSHNITLLFAVTVGVLGLGVAVVALGTAVWRPLLPRIGLIALGALVAAALNGWTLIPSLVHGGDTLAYADAPLALKSAAGVDRAVTIFHPWRDASCHGGACWQIPLYPLVWAAAATAFLVASRHTDARLRRALPGVWIILGLLAVMLSTNALWFRLPRLFQSIELGLRLHGHVVYVTAGMVILVLIAARARADRRWIYGGLCVALAVQVVHTAIQIDAGHPSELPRQAVEASFGKAEAPGTYSDNPRKMYLIRQDPNEFVARVIEIPPAGARDGTVEISGHDGVGTRLGTDIAAGPLVKVTGDAEFVGEYDAGGVGRMVLRVTNHSRPGTWSAVITTSTSGPVAAGRLASTTGAALAVAGLGAMAVRAARRRRAPVSASGPRN